jgi:2'-5' RNA ligase
MRYVIVAVVKGDAGDFNNKLRKEVFQKFGAKSSKLPAHFTIKAPFEYDGDIGSLEGVLDNFCSREQAAPMEIRGFDHFGDRVIYMKVNMSKEGKALHERLIDVMRSLNYITFDNKDGKNKIFHVTVSSKGLTGIYQKLWEYVNTLKCDFESQFDNVCIYRWENYTWVLHKEYRLR